MADQQQVQQLPTEAQQQLSQLQQQQISSQQQQVASATSVSAVKTVKTSKKVVTSKKTTSKTVKSSTTSSSSSSSSSSQSSSSTTTSSSSSSSSSATSQSVIIQSSGETYSQHRATFTKSGQASQQLTLDAGLNQQNTTASDQPTFQILLPSTPENAEATVIHLKAEDLISAGGTDGEPAKSAILSFNVSEFESQSIDVRTDGNKIEIRAQKKQINADGEERSEEFSRIYELPTEGSIDPAKLHSSMFQDGVLTIELPVGADVTVEVAPIVEEEEGDEGANGGSGGGGVVGGGENGGLVVTEVV